MGCFVPKNTKIRPETWGEGAMRLIFSTAPALDGSPIHHLSILVFKIVGYHVYGTACGTGGDIGLATHQLVEVFADVGFQLSAASLWSRR